MSSANRLAESVKPVVEQLEGRTLMSITISPLFTDSDGHVTFKARGDSKNDTLVMVDDPNAGELRIVNNGKASTIAYPGGTPIEVIDVDLGGGNDKIDFSVYGDPTAPVYDAAQRSLHLDGNSGNDTILVDIPGGIVDGSDIAIIIDGDTGNDNTTVNTDSVYDSKLAMYVTDGEGNDTTLVNLPTELASAGVAYPNYNSVVIFEANQGNGKNLLNLNAQAAVYGDSLLDVTVVGGNSTGSSVDTVNFDMTNSIVEGKMFVDINTLNGDDKINVLADGLYVETFNQQSYAQAPVVSVKINGGDGKDTITSKADTNGMYIDETAFASFFIRGGNGDDKINTFFTGPMDVSIGGQLVLNIDGQNNKDTIDTRMFFGDFVGTTQGGGGQVTLQILGGQNEDTMHVDITDLSTNGAAFGPGAFGAIIDGQSNTDKINGQFVNLLVNPSVRNFESSNIAILP